MRIYLPLFHVFVPWDRLRILSVEVVIRNEDGVCVRPNGIDKKFTDHEVAGFDAAESRVVRMHLSLIIVLEETGLHGNIPNEATSAEIGEVKTVSD